MKWDHIILEAYCSRKWNTKKDKYHYEVISTDPLKTEKIPNKNYDPDYKIPNKPKYCKDKVSYNCYENNCPHLATCNADKKDYELFYSIYSEKYKDDKNGSS